MLAEQEDHCSAAWRVRPDHRPPHRRVAAGGWLRVEKRRSTWTDASGKERESKWDHNVYELLAPFVTSEPTIRRMVRRAYRKRRNQAWARALLTGCRTNYSVGHIAASGEPGAELPPVCRCPSCRPDRPTRARAPWTPVMDAIQAEEDNFQDELSPTERRLVARRVLGDRRMTPLVHP